MLEVFGEGQGFLKAGFLGFPKGGKTHTAMLLALESRTVLQLSGTIGLFDTEASGEYIAPRIEKATGHKPVGKKSRSLRDLMAVARECEQGAAPILIVDSITHIWREVCEAYLDQVNKARLAKGQPSRTRLEFQDWANIKAVWSKWTDFYLNSSLHIIICGRAGYEWNFEETENADGTTRKELVKTGIKMKVESEFGFEPSLLIEMERVQVPATDSPDHFRMVHRARVLGDRFDVMDGQVRDNPDGAWFRPYLNMLCPGAKNVVDIALKTDMGVDESGDAEFQRMRRERTKLLEEIQAEIVVAYPGQSAAEKKSKAMLVKECFGTGSWTAVESMRPAELTAGLERVRSWIAEQKAPAGTEN